MAELTAVFAEVGSVGSGLLTREILIRLWDRLRDSEGHEVSQYKFRDELIAELGRELTVNSPCRRRRCAPRFQGSCTG